MRDPMRRARKRWVEPLLTDQLGSVIAKLESMNLRQLRATVRAMESCSQTNCWWGTYRIAQVFLPHCRTRLRAMENRCGV